MSNLLSNIDLLEIWGAGLLSQKLSDDYTDALLDGIREAIMVINQEVELDGVLKTAYLKLLKKAGGKRGADSFINDLLLWKFSLVYPRFFHYSYITSDYEKIAPLLSEEWLESDGEQIPQYRITKRGLDYIEAILSEPDFGANTIITDLTTASFPYIVVIGNEVKYRLPVRSAEQAKEEIYSYGISIPYTIYTVVAGSVVPEKILKELKRENKPQS